MSQYDIFGEFGSGGWDPWGFGGGGGGGDYWGTGSIPGMKDASYSGIGSDFTRSGWDNWPPYGSDTKNGNGGIWGSIIAGLGGLGGLIGGIGGGGSSPKITTPTWNGSPVPGQTDPKKKATDYSKYLPLAGLGIGALLGSLASGGGSSEKEKVDYNMTIPILDKRRVIGPGGQPIVQTAILGHYKLKPDGSVDTASVQHYKDPRVSTSAADDEEERKRREQQGYARGGTIRGTGGGLDDLIRARAGRQEIRLSNGEFVVPADVVSHLGDGSTDAGSQQLQQMIARVRQQKTGQQGQPRRVGIGALPR